MNDSIKRISLDINSNGSQETVNAKVGYTAIKLIISLVDGGLPYIISEDCQAVFTAKKPDKKAIYNDCTIKDNTIIYEFTDQTVAVKGRLNSEIRLYGADGKLIISPKFTINVFDTVYNEGDEIESSDEFNALTRLVGEAQQATEGANEAAQKASQTAKSLMAIGDYLEGRIDSVDLTRLHDLTPEEQAIVRANIGVTSAGSGGSISANVVDNMLEIELSGDLKSFIKDGVLIVA